MAFDPVTYVLAKSGANSYTDSKFDAVSAGVNYKGSVDSIEELPTSASKGDEYTVANLGYYVYDGTNWVPSSLPGPKGNTGDPGAAAGFDTPEATTTTLAPGQDATVEITASGPDTAKKFEFGFGIPAGFSPGANVVKSGGKATITITDTSGTTEAEVFDGKDGANTIEAGTGIAVDYDAEEKKYTISNTQTSAEWGNITGNIQNQLDLMTELNSKQNKLNVKMI